MIYNGAGPELDIEISLLGKLFSLNYPAYYSYIIT